MKKMLMATAVLMLAFTTNACKPETSHRGRTEMPEPRFEVAPLEQSRGQWMIANSDKVRLIVTAPGAQQARILDRPEGAEERIELGVFTMPDDSATGEFTTELNVPTDFAGTLSAEITYPDGTTKETDPIAVTTVSDVGSQTYDGLPYRTGGSVGTDESARSDKFTGGRIEKAGLKTGDPNIRITINVPAFQLTLWQGGKEVKTYDIGIGRKNFPLVIGEREATAIIFNPQWIPPDSAWVRRTEGIEPYDRIEPSDPRNPLGKIKIPLGDGYLIHEAAKPSDIGSLISHGCVRMLTKDLFDLSGKIIVALGLPVTPEDIERAREGNERRAVRFDSPLLVDVNYDTQVVEGDVLYLYPDVYDRNKFAIESLGAELQRNGIDVTELDERLLRGMMTRVSCAEQYAIRVADIRVGRFDNGQTRPLVAKAKKGKKR